MSEQQAGILTPEQVAAIAARADAATPGPFYVQEHEWPERMFPIMAAGDPTTAIAYVGFQNGPNLENARFFAFARTDVPALVASHEALRATVEALRESLQ